MAHLAFTNYNISMRPRNWKIKLKSKKLTDWELFEFFPHVNMTKYEGTEPPGVITMFIFVSKCQTLVQTLLNKTRKFINVRFLF